MKPVYLSVAFAILLAASPAQAHKVIASVFRSGTAIEGEIGFSNGDMAANHLVEVFDAVGNKIGETQTDDEGFFTFTPTEPVTHVFRADLGAGHVAEVAMEASEIATLLGKAEAAAAELAQEQAVESAVQKAAPGGAAVVVAALTEEEKEAIADVVRDEVRPLRREIAAYKEHNNFQNILGGVGYIVGLFGVAFYVAARRKVKA
ncbi:cobalt ABC transporter permease [Rhodospirillaceae bacterium KN72]|uniref:Cobalt ABC transporter permease n=1 Tax=Pacificispira spongiicola TaxID=2729598 RepID=A0A7Y0HCT8_9PROT|nr:cobalt ABC transporter permease [Pacificispira spongiicola]NMM43071.1 cobalt ABC transporter permease [Pacificispira spongiicola]